MEPTRFADTAWLHVWIDLGLNRQNNYIAFRRHFYNCLALMTKYRFVHECIRHYVLDQEQTTKP